MNKTICVAILLSIMTCITSCDVSRRNIMTLEELPSSLLGGTARIFTEHKTSGGIDYVAVVTFEHDGKHIDFTEEYVSNLKVGDKIVVDPDFSVMVTKYERDDDMVMRDYTDDPARRPGVIFITDEWYFRHNNDNEGDPDKWQLVNVLSYFTRVYEYSGDAFWIPLSDNCRILRSDCSLTASNTDELNLIQLDRTEFFELLDSYKEATGRSYIHGEYWTMNNKVIEIVLLMDDHL